MRITEMVVSTADKKLEPQILPRVTADINTELKVLNVYRDAKKQTWLGFGSALTEAAAYCYAQLPEDKKKEVLRLFYSKEGLGYELGRMHIGSCDFATQEYAYTEPGDREMKTFDLGQDRKYVLPMVKDIVAAAPELFLFASPWSPPPWMKSNGSTRAGGELLDEWKTPWAEYVARYLESYAAEGVQIPAMTVQNEPWAAQTWESCRYTAEGEAELIRDHLGPVLDAHGIPMKFIIWDHNKERIFERACGTLDEKTRPMVEGIAFHWYTGDHFDAVRMTHEAFPEKDLMFSEGCVEYSVMGGQSEVTFGQRYAHDMIGNLNAGMNKFIDWNMYLDEIGGPNHVGNYCGAPVMLDGKGSFEKKVSYYYIGHFSKYIQPGATHIGSSSYSDKLEVTAARNPDGSIALVVLNRTGEEIPYNLRIQGQLVQLKAEQNSIATAIITE